MIWNKKLRTIENNRFIALFNGSSTLKVLKNDFDIINKILENNVQLRDIEECFERKEDAEYIIKIIQKLIKEKYIVEESEVKNSNFTVSLLLTNRCNLSCKHCCQDAETLHSESKELRTEEIFNIIDRLKEYNVTSIMISGGEPLVRKDFMKIIEYLNQRINCHKTLMTNGLLINDTNIDFIIKNFDELSISLDGCDKELTEIVRGVDIFDTILDKVKKLHKKEYYNILLNSTLFYH